MTTSIKILLAALLCIQFGSLRCRAEQIEENWQPYVTYKPDPVIPAVALRKGWGGIIVCRLTINPKNGQVDEVKVVQHSRYPTLDAEAVMTMFKWKFRPSTITHAKISYHLGVLGRARDLH